MLILATVLNLATYAPPWMAALPGLGYRQATVLTLASTSSTYIAPGGAAVGIATSYAMLRGWGLRGRPVTIAVAVTGIWNQFAMLGFPIIALAALTVQHEQNGLLQTVALIGLAVFVVAVAAFAAGLSTPRLARKVGDLAQRLANWGLHLIRRGPVGWSGISFVRFRNETVALLGRRWHVLTLATLAGQLTVFLVMLASLRVCGVSAAEVSLIEAFAGVVARTPARLAPDHAGRDRDRRGRADRDPRRLRGRQRRRRRGRPDLPLPDDRADAPARPPRRRDLAPAQPAPGPGPA